MNRRRLILRHACLLAALLLVAGWGRLQASEGAGPAVEAPVPVVVPSKPLKDVLPPEKWHQVEQSVDQALAWLASQQNADGSFPAPDQAQPAVTSQSVLAFLSRGHQSGIGPYGDLINRGVDYVLSFQQPDGAFSRLVPEGVGGTAYGPISRAGGYNHPFAGLMLGEVYGQVTGERERKVRAAIEKALQYSRALQTRNKPDGMEGGFRYLNMDSSDLSVTVGELMFLRSARNAEFDVPQQYVDEALAYVHRSADVNTGIFSYMVNQPPFGARGAQAPRQITNANGAVIMLNRGAAVSRGIIAGGIVALSMGGQHQTDIALAGGDYLMAHPVTVYGERQGSEHFFYTCYYYSQAVALLSGQYWENLFPPLADAFLGAQSPDGSWPADSGSGDAAYGNDLTTAMAVLTLTTPFELLPVFQR